MPKLAAVLLTYNRETYALATIRSLYKHVTPKPHMHIADDGSPVGYVTKLGVAAKKAGAPDISGTITVRPDASSYGHNFNLATQVTHSLADYLLMLEDDWELTRPLDLGALIEDMEAVPQINCIRLGYLSWTQQLGGVLVDAPNGKYLMLDPSSPEPHVFAGHPRLERVSFQRDVGPWPEGLLPGQTEFAVTHMPAARQGIAWPLGLDGREGYGYFAHIGSERSY